MDTLAVEESLGHNIASVVERAAFDEAGEEARPDQP